VPIERFDIDAYKDGQIYVSEGREQMLHAKVRGPMDVEVHVGRDGRVTVEKMYGPLAFMDIRISLDVDSVEWVVERLSGADSEWHEWARIPGQLETDFEDAA
jgi:hypothetical protein